MPSSEHDEWDEILDRGIATYIHAEPHPSLARRVLARVDAVKAKPQYFRWRWAIAAALLVGVLVGGGMLRQATPHEADISYRSIHALKDTPPVAVAGKQAVGIENRLRGIHQQRRHLDATHSERREQLPKLDQFPTPSSLTAAERELIAFALQHPKAGREVIEQSQRLAEPIQIAAIHIAPLNLNDTSDTQAAKKDENEK